MTRRSHCSLAACSLITLCSPQLHNIAAAEPNVQRPEIQIATELTQTKELLQPADQADVSSDSQTLDQTNATNEKAKRYYIKIEPRLYNTEMHTESYGGVTRIGTVIESKNITTIIEIGPQLLSYESESVFSIDAAVESYWAISRSVEVYGRWYPSYLDGYGSKSVTNTMAAGAIIRLNGGVVDVNQYTGLAALSKGQYIKAEQDVSTSNGLNWSGNRTSARIGWAAQGRRWSLVLEAGISYNNDIYDGARYQPSGVFEWNYQINNSTSLIMSYYPYLSGGSDLANRGELGLALVRRF